MWLITKLSRTVHVHQTFVRYFCIVLFLFFIVTFFNTHFKLLYKYNYVNTNQEKNFKNFSQYSMKYILLWTSPKKIPFVYFGEGNSIFVNKSCEWTNCYVTNDRNFFKSYTEFDVVAFNGPQLPLMIYDRDWPTTRQDHQKYVFANIESAANYPILSNVFNNYFNWTWTYKLNSDAVWGYYVIRDAENNLIGPKENINWILPWNMTATDRSYRRKLGVKRRAAAWLCSSKETSSRREDFVIKLQKYLEKYHLKVDIFGECGKHSCPRYLMSKCLKNIQRHYFFYLAFENSFSDDYVTEKVLHALNHDTVPIVYGGAKYSRFLPPGSYLDAAKMGPEALAKIIVRAMSDIEVYSQFFSWKNHYSFHVTHNSPETDVYCKFCAMVNNETLVTERKSYRRFNDWWMDKVNMIQW